MAQTLANVQAAQLAAQVANWAAQLEFQKQRMQLLELPEMQGKMQIEIDRLAFDKAQAVWQQAIQEATLTGTYQGQPTVDWLERQAKLTGVLNGQQTLEGKLTDAQIAQMNHAMTIDSQRLVLDNQKFDEEKRQFGLQFAEQQEQNRVANKFKEADITGLYNGQDTLAAQQMKNQQVNQYLNLVASLQGNPFKMLRVLGNTPQGLTDLVNAWAGKYAMGGTTGSGMNPGAPTLADILNPLGAGSTPGTPGAPGGSPPALTQPVIVPPGFTGFTPPGLLPQKEQGGVPGGNVVQAPSSPGGPIGPMIPGVDFNPTGGERTSGMPGSGSSDPGGGPIGPMIPGVDFTPTGGVVQGSTSPSELSSASAMAGYTYSPAGTQAPVDTYNYQNTPTGQTQVYPPGVAAPPDSTQISTTAPVSAAAAGGVLGAESGQSPSQAPLSPNQINAENYANTNKAAQNLMWQYFEDAQGWAPGAAQDAFLKSLPRYGGPKQGAVAGLGF